MSALRTLLHGVVDYAGLFPPAGLDMRTAARNYAAYRAGDEAWMLGRFVVLAARLGELEQAIADEPDGGPDPWHVSALLSADLDADLDRVDACNARRATARGAGAGGRLLVDAVELRVADVDALTDAARRVAGRGAAGAPYASAAYVEVPLEPDPAPLAAAARRAGVRLKARAGGVTADAFPAPGQLLRFLQRCAEHDVACKATAGLHHPLRGEHPLTYEPGCARGTMFGFLGVFLAGALLRAGAAPDAVLPLLEERDPAAFVADDGGVTWRGPRGPLRASATAIAESRARGVTSFGSCSFEEPVADLRALGLLPRTAVGAA